MAGTLYLVATPIGNLQDITLRALNTLQSVDLIAAEDTRNSRKLLTHFNITRPLISFHEHSTPQKRAELVQRLQAGESIALISDAGMPLLSDPGAELVADALAVGLEIVVVPGASAALTALVASGLSASRFAFEGFLPRKSKERRQLLAKIKEDERTLIFYEAPHRLLSTLEDLLTVLGDRQIAVCRELTKKFEEIKRAPLSECLEYFTQKGVKGEFCLVVEGYLPQCEKPAAVDDEQIAELMSMMMQKGMRRKEAARQTAETLGIPVKKAYDLSID